MRVDLSTPFEPIRKKIEHESFGSCVLLMRTVGIDEQAEIDAAEISAYFTTKDPVEAMAAKYMARARVVVVGWEGVEDNDGKPLPFSWPTLRRVGSKFPEFTKQLMEAVEDLSHGLTEDESKNSPSPLDSGTPAAEPITLSLDCGTDSAAGESSPK